MLNSTDLKNGVTFLRNDKPYKVVKYALIKMGRGGATVKLSARNMETGSVEPISMSSNVKVDEVTTNKRHLQYLYKNGNSAVFMDPSTYEQIEIPTNIIAEEIPFIKEGENTVILFWDDPKSPEPKPLAIDIPPKVTLEIIDTDPGVKGNSASNVYKSAKVQNGLEVKVPLFINKGDHVIVDTRDGTYVERAK